MASITPIALAGDRSSRCTLNMQAKLITWAPLIRSVAGNGRTSPPPMNGSAPSKTSGAFSGTSGDRRPPAAPPPQDGQRAVKGVGRVLESERRPPPAAGTAPHIGVVRLRPVDLRRDV